MSLKAELYHSSYAYVCLYAVDSRPNGRLQMSKSLTSRSTERAYGRVSRHDGLRRTVAGPRHGRHGLLGMGTRNRSSTTASPGLSG